MAVENGVWIMRGLDWDDPGRIRSWQELADWIDEVGFLPLFKKVAAEEGVSLLKLIAEVSAVDRKAPSEELIRQKAAEIRG